MRRCEHCGGRLFVERDLYGSRLTCLNCGRGRELQDPPPSLRQRTDNLRSSACPRCANPVHEPIANWLLCPHCGPLAREALAPSPALSLAG